MIQKKTIFLDILVLLVISCIPLLWFQDKTVMVGHDNVYPLRPIEMLADRLYTWSENHGFGYDQSAGMGSIMIHVFDALPSSLGFSVQTGQKIVYVRSE